MRSAKCEVRKSTPPTSHIPHQKRELIYLLKDLNYEKTTRKTFAKIGDFIEIPNLIQVQKDSYDWFVKEGLGEVLKDISPIIDYSGNLVLEFFDYYMEEETKYSLE